MIMEKLEGHKHLFLQQDCPSFSELSKVLRTYWYKTISVIGCPLKPSSDSNLHLLIHTDVGSRKATYWMDPLLDPKNINFHRTNITNTVGLAKNILTKQKLAV